MSSIGTISIRYARAFLAFAEDRNEEEAVYNEMNCFYQVYMDNPGIMQYLENPIVTSEERVKLLLLAAGKTVSKTTEDFIRFIVKKRREVFLIFIAVSYQDLYRQSKNIISVQLTSASEMSGKMREEIKTIIQRGYKDKTIWLNEEVNPELIGGFVLNIENNKLDASVSGELKEMKKELGLFEIR